MSNLDREPVPALCGGRGFVVAEPVRELLSPRRVKLGGFARGATPMLPAPFEVERERLGGSRKRALVRDLAMAGAVDAPDIVHCHTWYAHLAGCLARPLTGARLVLTTHSLEPHRPWKVEQLGSAYHASTWIERTAYQNAVLRGRETHPVVLGDHVLVGPHAHVAQLPMRLVLRASGALVRRSRRELRGDTVHRGTLPAPGLSPLAT